MTFKIYEKGTHYGNELRSDEVSVGKSSLTLGDEADKFLDGDYAEVYLDREENLVGLKVSDNKVKGFRVQEKNDANKRRIVAGRFNKLLPPGRYACKVEGDFLVFKVAEIAKDS